MISQITIASMFIPVIFSFILFISLILFFKKRIGIAVKPLIVGAIGFFVITQVFEKLMHIAVVTAFPTYADHPWLFGLYGGFAAGIFEELGRLLLFTWILKQYRTYKDGISFGVGWGGIEAIILMLMIIVPQIIFSSMINAGTLETTIGSQITSEQLSQIKTSVLDYHISDSLFAIMERFFAVFIQIALSILVLFAIVKRNFTYVLLAILIHAIIDFPAVFYQTGHLKQLWVIEVYFAIIGFISMVFIKKSKQWFSN